MKRKFLSVPTFDTEELNQRADLINYITLALIGMAVGGILVEVSTPPIVPAIFWACIVLLMLAATAQLLMRFMRVTPAAVILVMGTWVLTSTVLWVVGGYPHPVFLNYFNAILMAGLLLGGTWALGTTLITFLMSWVLMNAQTFSLIPTPKVSLLAQFLGNGLFLGCSALLLFISLLNLKRERDRANKHQEALILSNRALDTSRATLEQRVKERTNLMEQRSRYLQASAEVSRAAFSIMDSGQLIRKVVDLVKERFDLYYVGLFLLDDTDEWVMLRAGTGNAGQIMMNRGHRIRVGSGMVGWAVSNGQPRVAQAVGEDAIRLATSELPDTRSEAALPLRSRGKVIGALTVQSEVPSAFDAEAITILMIMADQVAVALDNARLFADSQQALDTLRQAYGEASRKAWQDAYAARPNWGYTYNGQTVQTAENTWTPEMVQALAANQPVQTVEASSWMPPETGTTRVSGVERPTQVLNRLGEGARLAIPIKIRNQPIGVISLRKHLTPSERAEGNCDNWTTDEITILEAITEQVAQALESARLYEETQQKAEQERLIGEITAQMRSTLDVETVLRTAVDQIYQAMGLKEMTVWISPGLQPLESEPSGSDVPAAADQASPSVAPPAGISGTNGGAPAMDQPDLATQPATTIDPQMTGQPAD